MALQLGPPAWPSSLAPPSHPNEKKDRKTEKIFSKNKHFKIFPLKIKCL
jgi:hypothetical protein